MLISRGQGVAGAYYGETRFVTALLIFEDDDKQRVWGVFFMFSACAFWAFRGDAM